MDVADAYRRETLNMIRKVSPVLDTRYRLSLQIIFDLYLMVFQRIDPENGQFTREELNPRPDEVKSRVFNTLMKFL